MFAENVWFHLIVCNVFKCFKIYFSRQKKSYVKSIIVNATTFHFCLFVAAVYETLVESEKEASYANHIFGRSLGHPIAYAYSFYLYISTNMYVLIAVLLLTQ